MLDVGTDRQSLLDDPLYIGNRHPRVPAAQYDEFLAAFVAAVKELFPLALLHWEDMTPAHARRLLTRYREELPTFNDDIQGTGAVNLAAVLAAVEASGISLACHRIVIHGAGTAGTGIADQLIAALIAGGVAAEQARSAIWAVDRHGLIEAGDSRISVDQIGYARSPAEVADWQRDPALGGVGLTEVVRRVHPTVLIGTSARGGAFTEDIVKDMAVYSDRPVILPMSNPTELAEARPASLIEWTGGRALVATGSPFPPVDYRGTRYVIGQANNALVFPGLGLGAIVARASRITDRMLSAAAHAVAGLVDAGAPGAPLLPEIARLRDTSLAVAVAVAHAAADDGVARAPLGDDITELVRARMWQAVYRPVRPA
jgi:malate dehydrogenase (oxaloacetate-decarboxylating)